MTIERDNSRCRIYRSATDLHSILRRLAVVQRVEKVKPSNSHLEAIGREAEVQGKNERFLCKLKQKTTYNKSNQAATSMYIYVQTHLLQLSLGTAAAKKINRWLKYICNVKRVDKYLNISDILTSLKSSAKRLNRML